MPWSPWQPGPIVTVGGLDAAGLPRDDFAWGTWVFRRRGDGETSETGDHYPPGHADRYRQAIDQALDQQGSTGVDEASGPGSTNNWFLKTQMEYTLSYNPDYAGLPGQTLFVKTTYWSALSYQALISYDPLYFERNSTLWPTPETLGLLPPPIGGVPVQWEWMTGDDGFPIFAEFVDGTVRFGIITDLVDAQGYKSGRVYSTDSTGVAHLDMPAVLSRVDPARAGTGNTVGGYSFDPGVLRYRGGQRFYEYEAEPVMGTEWGTPVSDGYTRTAASFPLGATWSSDSASLRWGRSHFDSTGKLVLTLSFGLAEGGDFTVWLPTHDGFNAVINPIHGRDLDTVHFVAEYQLPPWRYWLPLVPPLRQRQRGDGLVIGDQRQYVRGNPKSLQSSVRQLWSGSFL